MSPTPRAGGRVWPLLLAYPVFAVVGGLTHQPAWSLFGLGLAATAICLPGMRRRQARHWMAWLAVLVALGASAAFGRDALVLAALPALANLLLAVLFARTLRRGRQPLVARLVETLEGPVRLGEPGVARYARQVTWFWSVLLGAQGVLLGWLALAGLPVVAEHPRLPAGAWSQDYQQFGAYAIIALAFVLEYALRRWRLRHLAHLPPREFARRMVRAWPRLLGDPGTRS